MRTRVHFGTPGIDCAGCAARALSKLSSLLRITKLDDRYVIGGNFYKNGQLLHLPRVPPCHSPDPDYVSSSILAL
jgi:hypothetical protein